MLAGGLDGARLREVQAKVALIIQERAHQRRRRLHIGRPRAVGELLGHRQLEWRQRHSLRRWRRARERAAVEEEDGAFTRVERRQPVLAERTLILQLEAILLAEQQNLLGGQHEPTELLREEADAGVLREHETVRCARLGVQHEHLTAHEASLARRPLDVMA